MVLLHLHRVENASDIPSKLKALRARTGMSINDVAEAIGVSKSSYAHYEQRYKKPYLPIQITQDLATVFSQRGVPDGEVLSLAGLGPQPLPESPSVPREKYAEIPRYKAELAAGAGAWNPDQMEPVDFIPFTWEFMQSKLKRDKPAGLIMLGVSGDSMTPTINDDDLVMVDTRRTRVDAGIYAFVLGGVARVKRFSFTVRGVQLISDNERYATESYTAAEFEDVQIIGRVVWVGRVI